MQHCKEHDNAELEDLFSKCEVDAEWETKGHL
jgi:hypothetical protein